MAYYKKENDIIQSDLKLPYPIVEEVEVGYDGKWYEKGHAPKQPLEEQVQAAYAALDSNVEKRLNDFAATRRYASIYTACNARDSQIAKYAAEGAYCFKMWGETYAKCEELVAEYMPAVLAGERPIPTWEEIEAQLPPLVWPDEQVVEDEEKQEVEEGVKDEG